MSESEKAEINFLKNDKDLIISIKNEKLMHYWIGIACVMLSVGIAGGNWQSWRTSMTDWRESATSDIDNLKAFENNYYGAQNEIKRAKIDSVKVKTYK